MSSTAQHSSAYQCHNHPAASPFSPYPAPPVAALQEQQQQAQGHNQACRLVTCTAVRCTGQAVAAAAAGAEWEAPQVQLQPLLPT
jgi:hypothetical protein